jgi:hypothetical protein
MAVPNYTNLLTNNVTSQSADTLARQAALNPDKMFVQTQSTPDQMMADIARSQYGYYQDKYIPFENSIIDMVSKNGTAVADARKYFDKVNSPLFTIGDRMNQRYGVQPNQRQAMGRSKTDLLNLTAGKASALTDTAQTERNSNIAMLGQMAALGRGLSNQAVDGIGTAAANEASRQAQERSAELAKEQAAQQQNAAMASSAIAMIGMGLMMSDERLKENIQPIENALEKLQAIRGVTWNWKENGEADAGVIAQEVEAVLPEFVVEGNDGYKRVNYTGLIGLLISAVKELAGQKQEGKE